MATGTASSNSWKLLWTNSSPTSSFSTQTVSIDLSKFSEVLIHFRLTSSDFGATALPSVIAPIDGQTYSAIIGFNDNGVAAGFKRNFVPSSNSIYFDSGKSGQRWSTTTETCMIPTHIYAR